MPRSFLSLLVGATAVAVCLPVTAVAATPGAGAPGRPDAAAGRGAAPGGPGKTAVFQPADKSGYGTAYGTRSKGLFTLRAGGLSDTYFPTASTPSLRGLQFVVTDGHHFTDVVA